MSTPNDKEIAWQGRIQERAASATRALWNRLESMPKSGFSSLTPAERRDIQETIAKQIADTMRNLGDTVAAGAQDYQVATLEGVNISKGKVKMSLIPAGDKVNLELLAANAGKQVVVAFINGVAYEQAREALSKAIHREQTDWINRERDREAGQPTSGEVIEEPADWIKRETEQPAGEVIEGTATAVVANISAHASGDLIADQPGDSNGEDTTESPTEGATTSAGGSESAPHGDGGAASDVVAGKEGADSGDRGGNPDVPPAPAARKPRRGRPDWAGRH